MVNFWAVALGLSLLLYVVLDGFDLGVGILFPFAPGERSRQQMMDAVAPVWDGNETWLVLGGNGILRGGAFEFRSKTNR